MPTLAMLFLHPRNQARFTFERKGARLLDGILGSEVQFREVARPTLVRDARGRDVPSRGKAWVDPTRGTILRIEATYDLPSDTGLAASSLHQTASVSTEFRRETALDAYVPIEMTELYVGGAGRIEAKARYSKFRRFSVETDEAVSSVGVQQPSPEKP